MKITVPVERITYTIYVKGFCTNYWWEFNWIWAI